MPPERLDGLEAAADRAAALPGHELLKAVITKELLHYDVLHALLRDGHLEGKSFVGGTALRLAHGGNRFSENLDFAAGRRFDGTKATGIGDTLQRAVSERYGLDVSVPEKLVPPSPEHAAVSTWTMLVETVPKRPDIPSVKVRLDISNVPSCTAFAHDMAVNHDDVSSHHQGMRIVTRTASEIAADEVVSSMPRSIAPTPGFATCGI